jgi:hypothetical protein
MTEKSPPLYSFHLVEFTQWIQSEKGLSASTANAYGRYVRAAFNAGHTLTGNTAFNDYVSRYKSGSRSLRRTAWRYWQRYNQVGANELLPPPRQGQGQGSTAPEEEAPVLSGFSNHLVSRGMTASTALQYVSQVRGALAVIADPTDAKMVQAYAGTRGTAAAIQFTTAWRHFVAFQPGTAPLDLSIHVPDDIAYAICYLVQTCGVMGKHASMLRWGDLVLIEEDDDAFHIRYINANRGQFYSKPLPTPLVELFRSWSIPFDEQSFLLTSEGGGTAPMTAPLFRALVTRGASLRREGFLPGTIEDGSSLKRAAVLAQGQVDAPPVKGW